MGYNKLSKLTLTDDERRAEATRIIRILTDEGCQMTPKEHEFCARMSPQRMPVTVTQLLWLRDIKDKYI